MQVVLAAVLCLVATASASLHALREEEPHLNRWQGPPAENEAPKPCCTPDQWEGYMGGNTGYYNTRSHRPGVVSFASAMSYDGKGKKVAVTMYTPKHPVVKVIMDYSVGKTYTIVNSTQYCKVAKTKTPFRPACIPKNAKFLGSWYQGAGASKLNENGWTVQAHGLEVTATVTRSGCIPVGEGVVGKAGENLISSGIGYSNITPGIKDPSVFTPPSFCKSLYEEDLSAGEEHIILEYMKLKFQEE